MVYKVITKQNKTKKIRFTPCRGQMGRYT